MALQQIPKKTLHYQRLTHDCVVLQSAHKQRRNKMKSLFTTRNIIIAVVVVAAIAIAYSLTKPAKAPAPAAKPAVTAPAQPAAPAKK